LEGYSFKTIGFGDPVVLSADVLEVVDALQARQGGQVAASEPGQLPWSGHDPL